MVDITKRLQVKIGGRWRELIDINRHLTFHPTITFSHDEKHNSFTSGYTSGWNLSEDLEVREMPKSARQPVNNTHGRTITL